MIIEQHDEVRKCFRTAPIGAYNFVTNAFTTGGNIDYDGGILDVGRIVQVTGANSTLLNRIGNAVQVMGCQLDVRCFVRENANQPDRQESVLDIGLYMVQDDFVNTNVTPSVQDLLKWKPFGYSSILDTAPDPVNTERKVRQLLRHKFIMKAHDAAPLDSTKHLYYKFKRPIKYDFLATQPNGTATTKYKFFVAWRSNIPPATEADTIQPEATVICKLFFQE